MQALFSSQLKLASKLKPKGKKIPAMKADVDIPISTEMIEWLEDNVNKVDDHGYLTEEVSSILTRPLDSFSMYCPTGAIVTSKYSTARIPEGLSRHKLTSSLMNSQQQQQLGMASTTSSLAESLPASLKEDGLRDASPSRFSTQLGSSNHFPTTTLPLGASSASSSQPQEPPPQINDVINRLNIMWLQRRAQLEREDGDTTQALSTLEEALKLHLGTTKYEDAQLGEPVVSSDPLELLQTLGDNYVVYDTTAHRLATKIQICYHRHYRYRSNAAQRVGAYYRGYLVRRNNWRTKQLRTQCAQLIQFRFRVHLARMHRLATMVKRWYKLRKDVKAYHKLLRIYQAARRIQRLFRGMKGRQIGNYLLAELRGVKKVQWNIRGYLMRRDRAFAIEMYHRLFYRSARRIQCKARVKAAVRRSQLKLLQELVREDERVRRERELIHHTIEIEMARARLYFKTVAGQLHLQHTIKKLLLCDKDFKLKEPTMTERERLTRRASLAFELHDLDGSGKLSEGELASMMRDLCVPMTRRKIAKLSREMDADGSGDIDFGELLDWYCKQSEQESVQSVAFGTSAIRRLLIGRQLAMKLTGALVRKRAELEILRQCTSWRSKDAISLFRQNEPPKYQCCQCLKPFVMFTDYYSHFNDQGLCGVLNAKGMYYDRFWIKRDWSCQRQVEKEIIRINGEVPYVAYYEMMGSFEDLSLQRDPDIKKMLARNIKAARHLFMERFTSSPQLKTSAVMLESITICKSKSLSPVLAWVLSQCIQKPVPTEWLLKNEYNMEKVRPWVVEAVDSPQSILKQLANLSCIEKKVKGQARTCANLHVKCLHTLQVSLQASLVALVEYRVRRKRTIKISDKELEFRDLGYLTSKKYFQAKNRILKQLKILQAEFVKLNTVQPPSYCTSLLGPRFAKYLPIGPGGEITEEQLKELALQDAHARAKALWRCRLLSEVGRVQRRRLCNEQWAARRLFWANCARYRPTVSWAQSLVRWLFMNYSVPRGQWATDVANQWRKHADLEYIFNQYAIALPDQDPTVQIEDFALLERPLALRVRQEDMAYVLSQLDQTGEKRIKLGQLANFLESEVEVKRFHSTYRVFLLRLSNLFRTMANTLYSYHGQIVMHMSFRNLTRVELRLLDVCNDVFADIAESLKTPEDQAAEDQQATAVEPNAEAVTTNKDEGGKSKSSKKSEKGSKDKKDEKSSKDKKSDTESKKKDQKSDKADSKSGKADKEKNSKSSKSKEEGKDSKSKKSGDSKKDGKSSKSKKGDVDDSAAESEKKDKKVSISAEAIAAKEKANAPKPPRIMTFDPAEELQDPPDVLRVQRLEAESEVLLEKEVSLLTNVKSALDEAEIQLIFRMEEDAAEKLCKRNLLLTRRGRYSLFTERAMIVKYDEMIAAYGCCLPKKTLTPFNLSIIRKYAAFRHGCDENNTSLNILFAGLDWLLRFRRLQALDTSAVVGADTGQGSDDGSSMEGSISQSIELDPHYQHDKGWDIILSMFVYSFDTDCSGSFDEGEVRLLLDSAKCHLPERKILARFPEVRLDSSSCERLVEYLAERVHWRRNWFGTRYSSRHYPGAISISRRARLLQAALLLVSRSRQSARLLTAQAVSLVRTGKLLEQDNEKNESTLIVRSQVLAMRQVSMFLRTTSGRWVRKNAEKFVKSLWKSTVLGEQLFSQVSMFAYAIRLHSDTAGMLNTELPHLIHYLKTVFGFRTTHKVADAVAIIEQLSVRKNLNLYTENDLQPLLVQWFVPLSGGRLHWSSPQRWKLNVRTRTSDAVLRMQSLARQQAVLISMRFRGMSFADTNYRCSVLGLHAVITEIWYRDMSSLLVHSRAPETVERRWVPKEAIPYLLLSRGYSLEDCYFDRVPEFAGVTHDDGALAAQLVGVKMALQAATDMSNDRHTYMQYFNRWGRFVGGLPKFIQYKRIVRAMVNYTDDVNASGAMFLNELLSGISHCTVNETDA